MVLDAEIIAKSNLPNVDLGNRTKRYHPSVNQPTINRPSINLPTINQPSIISGSSGSSGSSSGVSSSSNSNGGGSSSIDIDGENIISLAEIFSGVGGGVGSGSSSGRKFRTCASTSTCRALSTYGTCCTGDLCNGANRASVG